MPHRTTCLTALAAAAMLLWVVPGSAGAQRRTAPRFPVPDDATRTRQIGTPSSAPRADSVSEPGTGRLMGGALAGGAVGAAVGLGIGRIAGTGRLCGDDACSFVYGVYGFAAGEAIGLPLGVHLAGGRRGSYELELVAATAVGALVAIPSGKVGWGAVFVAVPLSQFITAAVIETDGNH